MPEYQGASQHFWISPEEAQAEDEEEFFKQKELSLCKFCDEIRVLYNAESAALFYVTEQPRNSAPFIVMRGAAGPLRRTFELNTEPWRKASKGISRHQLSGFSYELRKGSHDMWPMTNQIWQLAEGRVANSNVAMDHLSGRTFQGRGLGDQNAYPGNNLETTFRSLVGIPIFAEGGRTRTPLTARDLAEESFPESASVRNEFFANYRVVGILKLENKRGLAVSSRDYASAAVLLANELRRKGIDEVRLEDAVQFLSKLSPDHKQAIETPFPDWLQKPDSVVPRKAVADAFSVAWEAKFTKDDMEGLALVSMQAGRLLASRVMAYAAEKKILVGEHEIGALDIRWDDIHDLDYLQQAAEIAIAKVKQHVLELKALLEFQKRRESFHAGLHEVLRQRSPMRDVTAHTKDPISLIDKLIRKVRKMDPDIHSKQLTFTTTAQIDDFGFILGDRLIRRGKMRLFIDRKQPESPSVGMDATLIAGDGPDVIVHQRTIPACWHDEKLATDADQADERKCLIYRILSPQYVGIDDLAGVRIVTDFESDIDTVLDELRQRFAGWGIELIKIDDLRDGGDDGYRAVHITVALPMNPYIPPVINQELEGSLGDLPRRIPVEIQVRTLIQDAWAKKTHDHVYKHENLIPHDLLEESAILSEVLEQADRLSDIVKTGIEDNLMPDDYGERRLIRHLRSLVPREDLVAVRFGMECARQLLAARLRYNGMPEHSFSLEVCRRLVHEFEVVDPNMLLAPLLRCVWHVRPEDKSEPGGSGGSARPLDQTMRAMAEELQRGCGDTLRRYRSQLSKKWDAESWPIRWLESLPDWFKHMQIAYSRYLPKKSKDYALADRIARLAELYNLVKDSCSGDALDDRLERVYLIEAAILQTNVAELPSEPGRDRRLRLLHHFQAIRRQIRKYVPNRPLKKIIQVQLDRTFRDIESQIS